jgi:uncharacterized membrane protein
VFKIFLALHLLTAVFAIGPLVHAATTASRGLRTADGAATASSARTVTLYSYISVVVIILGIGLMSAKPPFGDTHKAYATFGETWIWLSILLWLVAVGLALGVIAPTLQQATTKIGAGEAVESLTGKVAATGGIVGLVFAAIVFLMVYQPGH